MAEKLVNRYCCFYEAIIDSTVTELYSADISNRWVDNEATTLSIRYAFKYVTHFFLFLCVLPSQYLGGASVVVVVGVVDSLAAE